MGYKSFLLMFAFFLIGSVATRVGYARKAARGVAENVAGRGVGGEALANSLAGALFALLVITTSRRCVSNGVDRSLCRSHWGHRLQRDRAMDFERAYLITTFQPVAAGEDGGVSLRWQRRRWVGVRAGRGARIRDGLVWKGRHHYRALCRVGGEPA